MPSNLLHNAPAGERSLLELDAAWSGLPEAHARVAARLRVFVLNWDPLGWLEEPFEARATATGDGDSFELVLYVPLPDLLSAADAADLLGDLCSSVLEVGVGQELLLVSGAYAQLASAGKVPGLLSAVGGLTAIERPAFSPAKGGWEPIGLGAIQDLVQSRFGPVDLDRSLVALDPTGEVVSGCPACAGRRFGFPGDLADELWAMCPPHAELAGAAISERAERAEASNREGWNAIIDASAALSEPTFGLPLALLDRLQEAIERSDEDASDETWRGDAAAARELAAHLRGRTDDFEAWVDEFDAHDWLLELPWALARGGLIDEAVEIGDCFAELDSANRSLYANDAAVLLAEAGRADEVLPRVAANLRAFPRDVWTHVHAGDAYQALADHDEAERMFRKAGALAQAHGDQSDAAAVAQRLSDLLATLPGREHDAAEAAKRAHAGVGGQRVAAAIGRNEPCPCGSGRKYKKCCGA